MKDSTITTIIYKENKRSGKSILKDSKGNILRTANYVNNEKEGEEIFYLKDGEVDYKKVYKNGEVVSSTRKVNVDTKKPKKTIDFVDQKAEFPGGEQKLFEYLMQNTKYTPEAKLRNVQGTIYISFVIEKDGSLTNLKIVRGELGSGLDELTITAVENMPNWEPGKHKGEAVRSRFILPFRFVLR